MPRRATPSAASRSAGAPRSAAKPAKRPARHRGHGESTLSSLPTGRAAYVDTRVWLIKQHGLRCAYCDKRESAKSITLDHVAPRRGMTAYDRRDNLVLCCVACNTAKADKATMTWLLTNRRRAINLLRYGSHLSPLLVEMARDLAGPDGVALAEKLSDPDYPYAD